jgi:hypothetical protein
MHVQYLMIRRSTITTAQNSTIDRHDDNTIAA